MEIVLFLASCLIFYIIIRLAINHSDAAHFMKKNNRLLEEIHTTLKEIKNKDNGNNDNKGIVIDEKL
ncbi:hypothetical protein AB6A23_12900 [Paenibacillus tarimensis]